MTERDDNLTLLAGHLEESLVKTYGPLLGGESLRQALGYPTLDALRQAISRKTIPVRVLQIANRRSKHALARDVAYWLAGQRLGISHEAFACDGAGTDEKGAPMPT